MLYILIFGISIFISKCHAEEQFCSKWTTIQSGGSCWQIANDNGITVEFLKLINSELNCDNLWVGNRICVSVSSNKPPCTKTYNVSTGDYCYKIWTDNNLTETQLKSMNENLDCDKLSIGQQICVSIDAEVSFSTTTTVSPENDVDEHKPLAPVEAPQSCFEFYTVKSGNTCYYISTAYGMNLTKIQEDYDCDKLQVDDTICVSKEPSCQLRYEIQKGDTCEKIFDVTKTTAEEIEKMNEGVKCDNLQIGRKICVWSADDRELKDLTCTDLRTIEKDSTCYEMAWNGSITIDEFKFLNPKLLCSKNTVIPKGTSVCFYGDSSKECASIQNVGANYTCQDLTELNQISTNTFMELNPTLRCNKLNQTEQICVGAGAFKHYDCTESVRVKPEIDTCSKVGAYTGLTVDQIKALNPGIDCGISRKLDLSSLVCIRSLGMDTRSAQQIIIDSLKTTDPSLVTAYEAYTRNPNAETSAEMNKQIYTSIQKPDVNSKLKELYRQSEDVRKILNSQHPLPRQEYCKQAQSTKMSNTIKNCFCGDAELLVYCQALAVQNYLNNVERDERENSINGTVGRKKRQAGCDLSIPFKGDGKLDTATKMYGGCFGGGCTFPVGVVEIGFSADICAPVVEILKEHIKFCKEEETDCEDAKRDDEAALKHLTERGVGAKLQMCAVGSNLIKRLTQADAGLCWDIISADYLGFVGKLTVSSTLSLIVFKLKGGATIKVHGLAFPDMCDKAVFECEDYCKWKHLDWEDGKAYGFIEGHLFSFFGWEGIEIFDFKINAPKRIGCQAGEETAIVVRRDRTCKNEEDREIQIRCWSGDDSTGWQSLTSEWGFPFTPSFWGNTLFVCEFKDKTGQKIGFDVYGGKSKNTGKKSFYYVVKNDGVYFGLEKYKEDKLKGSWDNPCEEQESKEVTPNSDASEPTGKPRVDAASCGKRIVGYYTGWGEREITENQLTKLTHVIFAFVAMLPDGRVEFGPVSEDDPGPQAGIKAERRFLDMKKKARSVNSGVQVLFAVGGWDNSQYYASTAADPGKRRTFINSVADFLDKYGIDGVDIDWEYPDMKGGDKANYVTLVRELRERLNSLAASKGRRSPYLITLASAAGEWNLRDGYDLKGILEYADFINVMTYDYYGAWGSKWGAYTGTPAPLYYGSLKGFSGKLNADFTMRFYTCRTKQPSKLNMGLPFYGRFWNNVLDPIDKSDDMWRTAQEVGGKFEGGYVAWRNLEREGWNKGAATWHDKTKTPYILNSGARKFMGFENERSLGEKIKYADSKNLGGLMIWALDLDDDADTLLNLVSSASICGDSGDSVKYTCVPIEEVRWWTPENSDESKQGQCGKSAPLINGFYPVCDPDDPGYACCGAAGYCGSEEEYCGCPTCVDYSKNPNAILDEPIKPSRDIQWYSMDAGDGKRGRCGKDVPQINGKMAICNPDDSSKHCCSNGGYCGTGKEYCECDGCIDYKKQ